MLGHCSPRTLSSVSVASTKVALSLQGLGLAEPRRKVLVLCKGSTTSQDMGDTFSGLTT